MNTRQRKHTRLKVRGTAHLLLADRTTHKGEVRNVSMAGAYIMPQVPMSVGQKCRVAVPAGAGSLIKFNGEVVRVDTADGAVGIRITGISAQDMRKLYKLITSKYHSEVIDTEMFGDEFYVGEREKTEK